MILFNTSLSGFSREGDLYVPEIYTKIYKTKLLEDYGLGGSISRAFLYGNKIQPKTILKFLKDYDPKKLILLISQLSKQLSLRGQKLIPNDDLQKDLFAKAVKCGKKQGLKFKNVKRSELLNSGFATPETIQGLLGLVFSSPINGNNNPLANYEKFAFACICLNDFTIGHSIKFKSGSENFYYENLRKVWFNGALLGSSSNLSPRIYRFLSLHSKLFKLLNPQIKRIIREAFIKKWGVSIKNFYWLSFAVYSNHYGGNRKDLPLINCNPLTKYPNRVLSKYLKRISWPEKTYRQRISGVLKKYGLKQLQHPEVTKVLVSKPFLELEKNKFLLLGPHLLFRQIELSVKSAFIEKKPKSMDIRDYLGPFGICAEEFSQEIIEKCVRKSRGGNEGMIWKPEKQGKGPGDLVILNPNLTIVFEIKFRQPPLKAFYPDRIGLNYFKDWFNECYLSTHPKLGALHQLVRDCDLILNKNFFKFPIKKILPVFLNPEDLIFSYDFYEILQRKIKKIPFFKDHRVLAPLTMSIGDLEYIYGLDYDKKEISFSEILKEKATHPAGRLSAWGPFLKKLDLKYEMPHEEKENLNILKDTAATKLRLV